MAEIKIEQKKPVWPWLLVGLVIVALIVYFLVFSNKNNNNNDLVVVTESNSDSGTNADNLLGVKENNATVIAFVNFVENNTSSTSLSQAYINEAFSKLNSATNAMAGEIGYDIQSDLAQVKESTTLVADEPFETSSAKNIRNATDNSTTALQNMQQDKYPWLSEEVEELKSASASINPEVLTLEQKDAIKNYFANAADILEKMN